MISSNGDVRLGGEKPTLTAGDQVVTIRRPHALQPAVPAMKLLILGNGDTLPFNADGLTLSDDLFTLQCKELRRKNGLAVRAPLAFAAVLWFKAPAGNDEPGPRLLRSLQDGKRPQDIVLLSNGDRIEGLVVSIREDICTIMSGARQRQLPLDQVAAIAFNSELRARVQPGKMYVHLVLADGTRLALASFEMEAGAEKIGGKTFFGEQVQAPLSAVAAIDYRRGAAVYLSDLEAKSYEHRPFLGLAWPLLRNQSAAGMPMQLKEATYDMGLGMHAPATLRYALDGKYRRFEVIVGIDARAPLGAARIRVRIDDEEMRLANGGRITADAEPLTIHADVRNARELTLIADTLDFGDVQAHVNWAEARLIK